MANPISRVIEGFVALVTGGLARKVKAAEQQSEGIIAKAEARRDELVREARAEAKNTRTAAEAEHRERRQDVQRQERRLTQKEDTLDRKIEGADHKERDLRDKERELDDLRDDLKKARGEQVAEMERVSGLSKEDALAELFRSVESELELEAAKKTHEIDQRIAEEADMKARKAIALSIQRLTSDVVSETTVSVVPLPSDDMKGRLIGREGRNIRALEHATGVDLVIDDTPEAVTLSGYDPIRREVAKVALQKLMLDGRIHPTRIEETVNKARDEVEEGMRKAGEQAVIDAGVLGMSKEVTALLGRLRYRTSYGQNVLKHSVEVAHLAGMMASEIGANMQVCKAGALLHDLGKALTHEVEGGHAEIGGEIARKYGINPEVAAAIEEHHDDDRVNVEAFIVAAADAISGGRPGARRDTVEMYVKRLQELEETATSFDGVDKAYAIQAGREVRIMVAPQKIDDVGASKLAHDVAKKIQDTMIYPGQVKVTVVRETRSVGIAK